MERTTISITDVNTETQPNDNVGNLIELIKQFDIAEIEPELDEDVACITEGKYYFLSVLRDVFLKFKEFGDTELIVSRGGCDKNCYSNCPTAYQFMGNNSKETFAFVVDDTKGDIKEIHFCVDFRDENGVKGDNYYQFMLWAALKLRDMKVKRK